MGRIREKVWKCSDCGTEGILGRNKECPNCGSPREKGEMKSLKGQGTASPVVTDPELLNLARAGADWFCTHCTSGNIGNGDRCSKCGAPRYATAEEDHPDFAGDHRNHEGADAKLEREMSHDPREEAVPAIPEPTPEPEKPETIADVWARVQQEPPPPPPVEPPPSMLPRIAAFAGGAVLLALLIAFAVWASQTHDVAGSVTSMTWSRTVSVEQWRDTTARLWRKDTSERAEVPPVNGGGERAGLVLIPNTCRDEHYKTIQVECGSHQECKPIYRTEQESYSCTRSERESYSCTKTERYECDEKCRDLGNGFEDCDPVYCDRDVPDTCYRNVDVPDTCTRDKEVFDHNECHDVTDYCDKKLYESKCDYTTQEWVSVGSHPTSGNGKNFVWGEEPSGDNLRRFYSATYTVVASYTDGSDAGTHEMVSTDTKRTSKVAAEQAASDYNSWEMSAPVTFQINNLGGVSSVMRGSR